ncbi:MAG: hypothetical protein O2894_03095 [Planctomycetota bacterium]|nr:hypothetical protein [Planctomycetota bacterium]
MPKPSKTSRGGSKRGKFKAGKSRKGWTKVSMRGMSTRKDKKRD